MLSKLNKNKLETNEVVEVTSLPWGVRLDNVFNQMRKSGLLARQNFSCCHSCGCYELAEKAKSMVKKPKGFAFYHRQDCARIRKDYQLGRTPSTYLAFGAYENFTHEQVGDLVVGCLTVNGLTVEWNGEVGTRIEVILK